MARAQWNNILLAQSDDIVIVEGNLYFPSASLDMQYFRPIEHSSFCPWKGHASYYDIIVDGAVNPGAAFYYAQPKEKAAEILNRVAFWKGVTITP